MTKAIMLSLSLSPTPSLGEETGGEEAIEDEGHHGFGVGPVGIGDEGEALASLLLIQQGHGQLLIELHVLVRVIHYIIL